MGSPQWRGTDMTAAPDPVVEAINQQVYMPALSALQDMQREDGRGSGSGGSSERQLQHERQRLEAMARIMVDAANALTGLLTTPPGRLQPSHLSLAAYRLGSLVQASGLSPQVLRQLDAVREALVFIMHSLLEHGVGREDVGLKTHSTLLWAAAILEFGGFDPGHVRDRRPALKFVERPRRKFHLHLREMVGHMGEVWPSMLPHAAPRDVSRLLWGLQRMQLLPRDGGAGLEAALTEYLPRKLPEHSLLSLARLALSIGQLQLRLPWEVRLAVRARQLECLGSERQLYKQRLERVMALQLQLDEQAREQQQQQQERHGHQEQQKGPQQQQQVKEQAHGHQQQQQEPVLPYNALQESVSCLVNLAYASAMMRVLSFTDYASTLDVVALACRVYLLQQQQQQPQERPTRSTSGSTAVGSGSSSVGSSSSSGVGSNDDGSSSGSQASPKGMLQLVPEDFGPVLGSPPLQQLHIAGLYAEAKPYRQELLAGDVLAFSALQALPSDDARALRIAAADAWTSRWLPASFSQFTIEVAEALQKLTPEGVALEAQAPTGGGLHVNLRIGDPRNFAALELVPIYNCLSEQRVLGRASLRVAILQRMGWHVTAMTWPTWNAMTSSRRQRKLWLACYKYNALHPVGKGPQLLPGRRGTENRMRRLLTRDPQPPPGLRHRYVARTMPWLRKKAGRGEAQGSTAARMARGAVGHDGARALKQDTGSGEDRT